MKKKTQERMLTAPIDVSDGIPDRVKQPVAKRFILVLTVYVLWLVVLMYFVIAGGGTKF
ncbi:MAG TPA: hypothetical protein PKK48_07185 [Phycisphaerae bacterium]|nr:hypothetical protein [Phycisphaerae bacterium]HPS52734.1 hypothetical protein [Phycisphaerae bacterium]